MQLSVTFAIIDFMLDFLSNFFVQALIFILIIGLLWIGLRFVLRLSMRILYIGCSVIVFLGLCWIIFRLIF